METIRSIIHRASEEVLELIDLLEVAAAALMGYDISVMSTEDVQRVFFYRGHDLTFYFYFYLTEENCISFRVGNRERRKKMEDLSLPEVLTLVEGIAVARLLL